jgi:hypothetical protein
VRGWFVDAMSRPKHRICVRFENVGRNRLSWSADLVSISEASLTREVKRKKALASRGLCFSYDGEHGRIVAVSLSRVVGTFRIENAVGVILAIQHLADPR